MGATHPPGPAAPHPTDTWIDAVPEPMVGRLEMVIVEAGAVKSLGLGVAVVPTVDAVWRRMILALIPEIDVSPAPLPVMYNA